MKVNQKRKLTIDALAKFPKTSKNAIAQYLFESYPAVFNSKEEARSYIRRQTGTNGEHHRKGMLKSITKHDTDYTRENPFGLPDSKASVRKFIKLKKVSKILWLSDIHFPNQDNAALTAALKYGKEHDIDCIVLGGDILDNEPFTSHDAPPPIYSDVRKWFEDVEQFLTNLKKIFDCPIHWIEGNHDNWYKRYLMKKSPVLFHDEYYTLSSRLRLREIGIEWHDQNVILMAGKLPMTHGHLIVKGFFSPVNPAKGVYNKIKSSMLIGHCHTTSEHSESILNHDLTTTYSTGCLCTLAPDYDPFNCKHNLGFAMIEVSDNGNYRVHNKRIDYKTKEVY